MKKLFAMLMLPAVIGCFALMSFSTVEESAGYDIGDKVEDFMLPNIDGNEFSMSSMPDAKGFIVIFTCNTCPYAIAYEDRIIDLNNKYASKGYPVVAINPNDVVRKPGDSFEKMVTRAKNKGFDFPYLHDATQGIATKWGATKTPHVYLVKRNNAGELRVAFIGSIDDKPNDPESVEQRFLEDAIQAVEAGKKPDPAKVKAIGCTIKWKAS